MSRRNAPIELVAEISANHKGSIDTAIALVLAAKLAGASAVKLQTWSPERMVLRPETMITAGPWAGRSMKALYDEAHTPWEWHGEIFEAGRHYGIQVFSSVFDEQALEFLERIDCPRYKIASFEIVDTDLIWNVARTGKPIIISTGMASAVEIRAAYTAAKRGGAKDITMLHCSSAYPANAAEANLATMGDIANRCYPAKVGLSDHTQGLGVSIVAAAMGARMIERHLVLKREEGGLDDAFSLEPPEMAVLAVEIQRVRTSLGAVVYGPKESEGPQFYLRRSLHFARDMRAGEPIAPTDMVTARPGHGAHPSMKSEIIGRKMPGDASAGSPVPPSLSRP